MSYNFIIVSTTNFVPSSTQPEGDVPNALAKGVADPTDPTGRVLCVLQDKEIIPVTVERIEGDKVYFRIQFIDEYNGELSAESDPMDVGTIIKGQPQGYNLEELKPKYSTEYYISVD